MWEHIHPKHSFSYDSNCLGCSDVRQKPPHRPGNPFSGQHQFISFGHSSCPRGFPAYTATSAQGSDPQGFMLLPSSIVFIVTDCFAISTSTSKISPSELCSLIEGIYKRRTVISTLYPADVTSLANPKTGITFTIYIASYPQQIGQCHLNHSSYSLLESTGLNSLILMLKKQGL